MSILIIYCALLASVSPILVLFLRIKNSRNVIKLLVVFYLFLGVLCASTAFFETLVSHTKSYTNLGRWLSLGLMQINYDFTLDSLSASMCFIVLFISYCVHMYACSYMSLDTSFIRFFTYLPIFTTFMLILVLANNLVLLFVG
jgi:NADH:ubiquinone oxidoreductase subunit 5 (subunit L)/multisubunit Na+/H+ antiporter MnhA subunit